MHSFKLNIGKEEAETILTTICNGLVSKVASIEMGELSKVFSFEQNSKNYVVHFKSDRISFDKSNFIYEHYSSQVLPIPKVVKIGELNNIYYSISEKVSGKPISDFVNDAKIEGILNSLIHCLLQMIHIKIDRHRKFGWFSPDGYANQESWPEALASFFDENQEGFHENWTKLYEESFLEKSVFCEGYEAMMDLAQYSPSVPYLVHGDFHLGNMLSDGRQVTGIVDWETAVYGDFMYDVAGLHFWTPQLDFPKRFQAYQSKYGVDDTPYFEERLRCYMLCRAIDGLRFYAKKNDLNSYNYMKTKMDEILTT